MQFKNSEFLFLLPKIWFLKEILNNERSLTKSDPAIQIEPTTSCNISSFQLCSTYILTVLKFIDKSRRCFDRARPSLLRLS